MEQKNTIRTIVLTLVAMIAFAANSLLARQALGQSEIDAAGFTTVRLLSGALTLVIIMFLRDRTKIVAEGDWNGAFYLFIYAAGFSFAYLSLAAGTGALILFGAVQLTMIGVGLLRGESLSMLAWSGVALAAAGLTYLMLPGISAPSLEGAVLMTLSGVAWGLYSLHGRRAVDAVAATAGNFIRSIPFVLILMLLLYSDWRASPYGVLLATSSGVLASALGYIVWYAALKHLTSSRAASIQLSVPVIASLGGILFLAEPLTTRLIVASAVILGGIALVIVSKPSTRQR
ncbi:MAG: DMT family transporter [Acidiferrobacterales bacterium]